MSEKKAYCWMMESGQMSPVFFMVPPLEFECWDTRLARTLHWVRYYPPGAGPFFEEGWVLTQQGDRGSTVKSKRIAAINIIDALASLGYDWQLLTSDQMDAVVLPFADVEEDRGHFASSL